MPSDDSWATTFRGCIKAAAVGAVIAFILVELAVVAFNYAVTGELAFELIKPTCCAGI